MADLGKRVGQPGIGQYRRAVLGQPLPVFRRHPLERPTLLAAHDLDHLVGSRQKRLFQPHHHDAFAAVRDHGLYLRGAERHRLFHPHVEAGVQRVADQLGVLPWRHAQEHGIQLLVTVHLGRVAVAGLYSILVGGASSQLQVPIAQRFEPHRQEVQRRQNVAVAVRAHAHHGDVQALLEFTLVAHRPAAPLARWALAAAMKCIPIWPRAPSRRKEAASGKHPLSRLARLGVQVGCDTMH